MAISYGVELAIVILVVVALVVLIIVLLVKYVHFGLANGSGCFVNAECRSGACGRPNADASNDICCSGVTRGDIFDYCTGLPNGTVCFANTCSGVCRINDGSTCRVALPNDPTDKGVCDGTGQDDGSTCPSTCDIACSNNACGAIIQDNAGILNYFCCPSGAYTSVPLSGKGYCTGQGLGDFCYGDAMCTSGHCTINGVPPDQTPGTCIT